MCASKRGKTKDEKSWIFKMLMFADKNINIQVIKVSWYIFSSALFYVDRPHFNQAVIQAAYPVYIRHTSSLQYAYLLLLL